MSRPRSAHGYRLWFVLAALGTVTFGIHARAGQQKVEFRGGIPVAPSGLAGHKLPAQPVEFDTGEGQRIRVSAVTRALEYPGRWRSFRTARCSSRSAPAACA